MHAGEHLSEHVKRLSDRELIDRLRSGGLLDSAAETYRRELHSRGVDVDSALAQVMLPQSSSPSTIVKGAAVGTTFLVRAWRFPLRAVFGLEKPWAVLLFGGIALFVAFKLVRLGLAELWDLRPMPSYALPLAYLAWALFALAEIWLCVALWRSASRLSSTLGKSVVRLLGVLFAIAFFLGTVNVTRVLEQNLTASPKSPL